MPQEKERTKKHTIIQTVTKKQMGIHTGTHWVHMKQMETHTGTQQVQRYLLGNATASRLLRISPDMMPTLRHDMLQNLLVNLRQLGAQDQGSLAHCVGLTDPWHVSRHVIAAALLYQVLVMQSL